MKFVYVVAVRAENAPKGPTTIDVVNPKDPEEKPLRFRIVGRHDTAAKAKAHLEGTEFPADAVTVRADGVIVGEKAAKKTAKAEKAEKPAAA